MHPLHFLPIGLLLAAVSVASAQSDPPPTMASVLEASSAEEWESIPMDRLIVMQLDSGRVVIELAPGFAPQHAANILTLVKDGYFDDAAVVRSQDNYVVQWEVPVGKDASAKPLGSARSALPAEFDRAAEGVSFTALPDPDAYAPQTGFVDGFPAASDGERTWLAHCYGMVGAGRDNAADSSNGSSLYAVTGHAPRHLDRNITLVGRVIEGMPLLTTLPRGTAELGFYAEPSQRVPIRSVQVASEMPEWQQPHWSRLRTDSASFKTLIQARRFRHESWFVQPVGHLELCNMPLPLR